MGILKKLLLVLAILVAIVTIIGLMLPREVRVERSIVIEAPQATIFAIVNSFKLFNQWSPWHGRDPETRYVYAGPDAGVGAKLSWTSDQPDVGSGSQEIIESHRPAQVVTALDFGAQGQATARFDLSPTETGTRVTWGFQTDLGANPFTRYIGLIFERMLGPDYEQGLAGLKALAERLPKADFAALDVELVDVAPQLIAFYSTTSSQQSDEIAAAIGAGFGRVQRFITQHGLVNTGAPMTINTVWEVEGDGRYAFDAALPIDARPSRPVPADSPVQVRESYAGRALRAVHRGSYDAMPATYDQLFAHAAAHGLEPAGFPWDEYVTDPGEVAETDLITHIYLPVK